MTFVKCGLYFIAIQAAIPSAVVLLDGVTEQCIR